MYLVSLGPGTLDLLAPRALQVLKQAQAIFGYKTYVDLLQPEILQDKEVVSSGMTKEVERCQSAIDKCLQGYSTALVCSGDAGIYALAGLVFEILEKRRLLKQLPVEVVPGIPALAAGAALLGAPLMHDFVCISLSDLLTSWETIEKRINAAAQADFVLVFYNPRSKQRTWQLDNAAMIVSLHREPETPVGVVRNAGREGQKTFITTLTEFDSTKVDMLCTVFIGNSSTRFVNGYMLTPRGYLNKYAL